jgi:hypothetical protein
MAGSPEDNHSYLGKVSKNDSKSRDFQFGRCHGVGPDAKYCSNPGEITHTSSHADAQPDASTSIHSAIGYADQPGNLADAETAQRYSGYGSFSSRHGACDHRSRCLQHHDAKKISRGRSGKKDGGHALHHWSVRNHCH